LQNHNVVKAVKADIKTLKNAARIYSCRQCLMTDTELIRYVSGGCITEIAKRGLLL